MFWQVQTTATTKTHWSHPGQFVVHAQLNDWSNIFWPFIFNLSQLQTYLNHPSILLFSHGQAAKPSQVSVRVGVNSLTLLESCLNSGKKTCPVSVHNNNDRLWVSFSTCVNIFCVAVMILCMIIESLTDDNWNNQTCAEKAVMNNRHITQQQNRNTQWWTSNSLPKRKVLVEMGWETLAQFMNWFRGRCHLFDSFHQQPLQQLLLVHPEVDQAFVT